MRRKTLDRATAIVASVLDEWRPYEWADSSEWESEARAIARQLPRIHSPRDAAEAIARVFAGIDPERFTAAGCADAGARLFTRLVASGLAGYRH